MKKQTLADVFTRKRKRVLKNNDDTDKTDDDDDDASFWNRISRNSRKRLAIENHIRRTGIIRGVPRINVNDSDIVVRPQVENSNNNSSNNNNNNSSNNNRKRKNDDESVESVILLKHLTLHPINNNNGVVKVEETKKIITYPTNTHINHLTSPLASSSGYDTDETTCTIHLIPKPISPSSLLTRSTLRSDRTETIGKSPSTSSTISSQSRKSRKSKNSKPKSNSTSSKQNRKYKKKKK